jgi:hypothetical protein
MLLICSHNKYHMSSFSDSSDLSVVSKATENSHMVTLLLFYCISTYLHFLRCSKYCCALLCPKNSHMVTLLLFYSISTYLNFLRCSKYCCALLCPKNSHMVTLLLFYSISTYLNFFRCSKYCCALLCPDVIHYCPPDVLLYTLESSSPWMC